MIKNLALFILSVFIIVSCTSTGAVYKQDYNFSNIKNVYVDESSYSDQTQAIRDSIVKQLMSKGFNLKSTSSEADIIVSYSITEYQPSKKYLIRNNNYNQPIYRNGNVPPPPPNSSLNHHNNVNVNVYTNEALEISGSSVYDLGTAFGVRDSRIIASNATVGVAITMKDVSSNDIIWTNSYTYEGMDLMSAVNGVVRYILKSFPPTQIN